MILNQKYNLDLFKGDLIGGISVAALSLPVGVAYANIAGLPPESGIYTAIFSFLCYFILGSSQKLILGPDSATMTLFASTILSISAGHSELATQLIVLITVTTGILMFIAGFFKLGFIANFLSKPILLGYLNGVSIVLIISQLGKFTGVKLEHGNSLTGIWELITKAGSIHIPTIITGIAGLIILSLLKKISVKIPSQLILLVISIICAKVFNLEALGITFTGRIKNVYPEFILPDLNIFKENIKEIIMASAAIVFVSYTGEIPVGRAFTKDNLKPNQEFFALGLADFVAGLFRGFPVSGADSRTAVNVTVGGKTKMVNIFAALIMLFVILFLSAEFSMIPTVIFGAIIINAAMGMFKLDEIFSIRKFSKQEFQVTLICIIGVLLIGVYQGILIAFVLTLIQLIGKSSRPQEYELVYDPDKDAVLEIHDDNKQLINNEVSIYRFNASIIFYNSEYFKEKIFAWAKSKPGLKTIIFDATPINFIDLTALKAVAEVIKEFNDDNIKFYFAGAEDKISNLITEELKEDGLDYDIFLPNVKSVFIK